MYQKKYHIHFIGIGGIGMSGIAELLLNLGYNVSGSDLKSSEITRRLAGLGGSIHTGHKAEYISKAAVVVTSSAVGQDNPEVRAALKAGIPVIPRAEMLAELMRLKYSVAVAGAHGKTTVTSMIAAVLAAGGLDPTVVVGGKLKQTNSNACLGQGNFIVAEADESDGSFLKMAPTIAVITNIDLEHLDYYPNLAAIKSVFLRFTERIPFYGYCVLCLDNPWVKELLPLIQKRYSTYGLGPGTDFQARQISFNGLKSHYTLYRHGIKQTDITLHLPGYHNITNSLAAVAVGFELGLDFNVIRTGLEAFKGVKRRMEIKGQTKGILVVDDYGHHPTEIKATLETVKTGWPDKRSVVIFQPHRYSRTRDLWSEFTHAFDYADLLMVLPIYAAGEKPISEVDSKKLVDFINSCDKVKTIYVDGFPRALEMLKQNLKPGDVVLTLGAGDVWKIGTKLLEDV